MNEFYIDVKETCWNRYFFETQEDFQNALQNCIKTKTASFEDFDYVENLLETCEKITVEENNGSPTVEAYFANQLVWDNTFPNLNQDESAAENT